MSSNKHDIIYTAKDIQRYLAGGMEPAEMYALEKAALDDAFLAEAIEGYESMKDQVWRPQLASLKSDFAKGQEAKLVPMSSKRSRTSWKAAAAIVVIAAGLALTYYLSQPVQTDNIAKVSLEKDIDTSTPTDSTSRATNLDATAELKDRSLNRTAPRKAEPAASRKKRPASSSPGRQDEAEQAALAKEDDSGSINDSTGKPAAIPGESALISRKTELDRNEVKPEAIARAMARTVDRYSKAVPAGTAIFEGQVVAADGSPLPFARISPAGRETGNYADAKGKFRLLSADSILPIEIRSVGFITRNTLLKAGQVETIILAEDKPSFDDAGATAGLAPALGNSRKKKAAWADQLVNVAPEDGWANYETYIKNNLNPPPEAVRNEIHGDVEISFEVNSAGAMTNMKVDKSLCEDCDAEAMRVIRDGPRWKLKKGSLGTAKLKLKF